LHCESYFDENASSKLAGHLYGGGTENAKSLLGFNGCSVGCRADNFHWHIRSEQL
jgi:hypothetical protein